MAATPVIAVAMRGVTKAFGDCYASRGLDFAVPAGTIHAIIGENGAGKSTAMKMLYGMIRPDAGEIEVDGAAVRFRSPRDAVRAGLGMVHQHFMLAGPHSGLDNIVLDNIVLGAEAASPFALVGRKAAAAELSELARAYGFKVDFAAKVADLPVGVQQRLEILKLLYRKARILILDEPTAVLTPQEADELFANLRRLKAEGRTVIIITHKLKEVMRLADNVTVFRAGQVVANTPVAATSEAELAALMVGRAVRLTAEAPPAPVLGAPALKIDGVRLARRQGKPLLDGVSLTVRGGEIVGIAGVEGNGQSELLALLADPKGHKATGGVEVLGRDARKLPALAVRDLGYGLVPEDRHGQGLILGFDLVRNFALGLQRRAGFSRRGFLLWGAIGKKFAAAAEAFDIRPRAPQAAAKSLSGGNQQKVVIAREFARQPRLLVAAQPTRGVDVGSIEFIHAKILEARAAGAGVLLVSSSLEEVMALSDRILVLFEGRITGEFARGTTDEATLGRHMGGLHA
jgi:simple sugar transport system ATP-binding protein